MSNINDSKKKDLITYLRGQFADNQKHQFVEKGVIDATVPSEMTPEQVEDSAILSEAEDFEVETSGDPVTVKFFCDPLQMFKVRDALKENGFPDADGNIDFLPQIGRSVDDDTNQKLQKLLSVIEEHVEVLRIFNNSIVDEGDEKEESQ